MSEAERRLLATANAHQSWANTLDRSARTAPARAALNQKFLDEADGDPVREHLRKAHFARLAQKSARARRRRRRPPPPLRPPRPSSTGWAVILMLRPEIEPAPAWGAGADRNSSVGRRDFAESTLSPATDSARDVRLPAGVDRQIWQHLQAITRLLRPRCSKCGRPLTASESVRIGIGPRCRRRDVADSDNPRVGWSA